MSKNSLSLIFWISLLVFTTGSCITADANLDQAFDNYNHPKHGWHQLPGTAMANPVPVTSKSIKNGKRLFVAACAPCHGSTGEGNGPQASQLAKPPANLRHRKGDNSAHYLYLQITMGRDGMPVWGQSISENDRWDIVNYIQNVIIHKPKVNSKK